MIISYKKSVFILYTLFLSMFQFINYNDIIVRKVITHYRNGDIVYKEAFMNYVPKNEQEIVDKKAIIEFIKRNPDALNRDNLVAHITSSSIVVNEKMDKVLFAYHNIYDSWGWLGGHNDDNPDLLQVALKEAQEETGIQNVRPFNDKIMMIDIIYVENHIKHGKYVSDHLHLNATYLLIANDQDDLTVKPDENQGVKWFNIDDVLHHITEPRMEPIYQKAFKYINKIKGSI